MAAKTYVVEQSYHGVATFIVQAETGKEALDIVNSGEGDFVQCDTNVTKICKAVYARLDKARPAK